jgi:ribonuclease P protein component
MPTGLGRSAGLGRLTKRSEFLRVAAGGRKWVTPGLILQALRRPAEAPRKADGPGPGRPREDEACQEKRDVPAADSIRVGFTASRKVGSAVARNRARRRLRAAVAEVLPGEGDPGTDYVVIARRGTLARPYAALLEDLRSALVRIRRKEAAK